jgi:hypothetical protein
MADDFRELYRNTLEVEELTAREGSGGDCSTRLLSVVLI